MNDMETLLHRFDRLEALLGHPIQPATLTPHPHNPRITSQQVTAFDNVTEQSDGSLWDRSVFSGAPEGEFYGFFTKAKDPVQWDGCVRLVMGRSSMSYEDAEAELVRLRGDEWNRFKMAPDVATSARPSDGYFLLSMMLANPIARE